MFKLVTCAADHPKKLNKLRRIDNLEALFNHYKDRPGFKEYIDAQFDFAKLSEMYLSARPNGYRKESIYHEGCAIKARLAYLTYIVDIFFPTNKARPKRNKQMAQCEEIESLIDYTQPFMLNPDRQVLLTQFSKHTYKHLRDEHDWFNFEGLIAFKLIAAVVASSRREDLLVLPSFTELPERVGRLRAARIVRKREREEVEGISPLPLKRRKKESLVTDGPSTPHTSISPLQPQQIASEVTQQNTMFSQHAAQLETSQTVNSRKEEQPVIDCPSMSHTSPSISQTQQTLAALTEQGITLSQYAAYLEELHKADSNVSSSQQIFLSREELIASLNSLKITLLRLKHYLDTVLFPALIADLNILPAMISPFYSQQNTLSSLENAVDEWLIRLTTPVSIQTACAYAATSQEPLVVMSPTQHRMDTSPASSETQNLATRTLTISGNTTPSIFPLNSPQPDTPQNIEDEMKNYLEENGDIDMSLLLPEPQSPETASYTLSANTSPRFFSHNSPLRATPHNIEDVMQAYLGEHGDADTSLLSSETQSPETSVYTLLASPSPRLFSPSSSQRFSPQNTGDSIQGSLKDYDETDLLSSGYHYL